MDWSQFGHGKRGEERALSRRVVWVAACLIVGFVTVGTRLVFLQGVYAKSLTETAAKLRLQRVEIPSLRGSIYDRDGELLAQDRTIYQLYADKNHIGDVNVVRSPLAKVLGVKRSELNARYPENEIVRIYREHVARLIAPRLNRSVESMIAELSPGGRSAPTLLPWLEKDEAKSWEDFLKENEVRVVRLRSFTKRFFPAEERMINILGRVNSNKDGVEGVEQLMNVTLQGLDGAEEMEMDALRQRVLPGGVARRQEPQHGRHLVLTVDMDLQHFLEDTMLKAKADYDCRSAQAILVEPSSGDILAMSGVPKAQSIEGGIEYRNLVVTDAYQPGSTMKIFTVAAGLQAEVIKPTSTLFCNNGLYEEKENDVKLRDHKALGYASIQEILAESSNIGAYKIAKKLDEDRLYAALKNFGFGSKTELNLPRESAGILRPVEKWHGPSLSSVAMGYEISVTPLQLVMAVAAIANHGTLMKPRLVESIVSADGKTQERQPTVALRQVCSAVVAGQVMKLMRGVVDDGTGSQAAIPGVPVAGKTGTAKLYDPKAKGKLRYLDGHYTVSFVGVAPADNPKLACLIVLEDPKSKDESMLYGGKLAAPIFSQVMKEALIQLEASSQRQVGITLAGQGGNR
ncbi:MAG: penicillin-binding protein 2 [Verrucomicrobiaceae bacterium]|nr:penicillin-binding protein 2 [Verrucomicrobiaceae bacterium]